jgi:2-polyprenyl-6-methoxyphenol hydroxylase-like FAD-dependent oxidoreductase
MRIVIAGGGPIGLATAMLMARDGHEVTVLEKDPQPPAPTIDEAWGSWERPGVAQWRQAHFMMPRFRHLLDAELPEVRDELRASGATYFNILEGMARSVSDREARPGDERFETLTARRPVLERAFATVAARTDGVVIRRGVSVAGPLPGRSVRAGVPHVAGVRTSTGEEMVADLVVDAMGRRSKLCEWITALGGRPPFEEAIDAGFAYYTRHYRSRSGSRPELRGPIGADLGTVRVLSVPADNDCWTLAIVAVAGDGPLKALRHNKTWERVIAAIPHVAHWLDGEPLVDVIPMAGVMDRYRRAVVDGVPVVTGLVPVGDAWACTNPTAGRGFSLGLAHAILLRDVSRARLGEPAVLIEEFDRLTEDTLTPWYRQQVDGDRLRAAAVQAMVDGRPAPDPPDPNTAARQAAFFRAAAREPDVARAAFEIFGCLALPAKVMSRPDIAAKVMAFADEAATATTAPPGPDRTALLAVVAA